MGSNPTTPTIFRLMSPRFLSRGLLPLWSWLALAAAVWAGLRHASGLGAGGWPGVGPHFISNGLHALTAALSAVLVLAAAAGAGRRLDAALGGALCGGARSPGERWPLWAAWGAVVLGFAAYAAALAGLANPWLFRAATMLAAASLWDLRPAAGPGFRWRAGLPFLGLALAGLFALLPETFGDSLHYVLAGPDHTLRVGRWTVVEGVNSFGYPGLARAWHLWPLAWAGDRAAKMANVGLTFFWSLSVAAWAARRWGASAGRWSAAVLVFNPIAVLYAGAVTAEPLAGLLLWSALARLLDVAEELVVRRRDWLVCGFLWGAAMAAKPVALTAAPAVLFLLWEAAGRRGLARAAGLVGAGALLPLLPWAVENSVRFGNPFHPYFSGWTPGLSDLQRSMLEVMFADQRGRAGVLARLAAPWTAAVTGIREGRVSFIGPIPLMLAPLAFFVRSEHPRVWRRVWIAGGLCALAFLATTGRLRFGLILAGPWAAAAGMLLAGGGRGVRAAALGALIFQASALLWVFHRFHEGTGVLTGAESAAQYLRKEHPVFPSPPTAAFDWLAANADPARDKVWLVGEFRAAGCPLPVHAHTIYDVPLHIQWLDAGLPGDRWPDALRAAGITHVLVNRPGLSANIFPDFSTPPHRAALDALLSRLEKVYDQDGVGVYRLNP